MSFLDAKGVMELLELLEQTALATFIRDLIFEHIEVGQSRGGPPENTFDSCADGLRAHRRSGVRPESAAASHTRAPCSTLAGRQIEPGRTSRRDRFVGAGRNRSVVC